METLTQVIMSVECPQFSGEHAEVLACEVRDYGGNVLWSGTTEEYDPEKVAYRIPTRIVATKLGKLRGCVGEYQAAFYDGN